MLKNKHMALILTLLLGGGLVSGNAGQIAAQTVSDRTERDFAKAVEAFDTGGSLVSALAHDLFLRDYSQ